MRRQLLPALLLILGASPAHAASTPDLEVTILPPAVTPYVYQSARYQVQVKNIGNRNAAGVSLTIQLPQTGTSPQVYIMGTLGARDARCTLAGASGTAAGTRLTCSLGTVARFGGSTTVFFDLAAPEKTGAMTINASATTTTLPETNPSNNSDSQLVDLIYHNLPIGAPRAAVNRHCTGTSLTAFYECTRFPSSIASHNLVFNADGTISFPNNPGYTGRWTQPTPADLEYQVYLDSNCTTTGCSNPEAEFIGRGARNDTAARCYEGLTRFPDSGQVSGYSPYVSPYEVCLQ